MNEILDSFARAMGRLVGLFRRERKSDSLSRIPAWSDLGRACIAIHIADASNVKKGRRGWATVNGGHYERYGT